MSSGRTSAPWTSRRSFSTRWGSGVIGAIASQAANSSNQGQGKRSSQFSIAIGSVFGQVAGALRRLAFRSWPPQKALPAAASTTACIVLEQQRLHSIAEVLLARLRNSNFWILPVAVLGIGSKRISLGTL